MWRYSQFVQNQIKSENYRSMISTHSTILPAELKALLTTGCCLVDVREPVEYAEAHIAGSKLIPSGNLTKRISEIDRNLPVIVTCRSGKRGEAAVKNLKALGVHDARNLEGGVLAWKAAGFPLDQSGKKGLPLMQQVQLVIGLGVLTGAIFSLTLHPNWVLLCAFFGAGLSVAGTTGWCGLAILVSKMPWNRASCESCCNSEN
jgi:rhodanese-related sulfurtransferase